MSRHKTPLRERFPRYVDSSAGSDACWPFVGKRDKLGYGRWCEWNPLTKKRDYSLAHRVAYALANDDLTDEDCVLHSCDNPPCCNPHHLHRGTKADNSREMVARERHPRGMQRPDAVLTDDIVRSLRHRRAEGVSWGGLAVEFGFSIGTIRSAVTGRSWVHIK